MKRAILVLVGLGLSACHAEGDGNPTRREVSAAVSAAKIERGRVERAIVSYGTVEFAADRQRTLSFVKPGQVTRVPVVAGQVVAKGDLLLQVGGVPRGAPEVQQATIDVDFAERELRRVQHLVDEKLSTNRDLEAAQKQVAAAKATLRGLGGGGAGGARMRAESDGVVARVLVQRGDLVQAGQAGVVLAARDSMSVRAGFEVEDLADLHEGLPVRLTPVFGNPNDKPAQATLSTLHRVVDAKTQLVEGLIHIPEAQRWLAAGVAVRATVVLAARENALWAPREALLERDGKHGVFVIDQGHAHFTPLSLGIEDEDRVEVQKGLTVGSTVVTTGRSSLSDGMAVRVTNGPR